MNKEINEVLVDREEILRKYRNLQEKYSSLIKSVNLIKKQAKQETTKQIKEDIKDILVKSKNPLIDVQDYLKEVNDGK